MNVNSLMNDVKVAATVALSGMGTGLSMFLALIPNDIGKLASLVAIVLTAVLIRNHLRNGRKLQLEIRALEAREEERKESAEDRRRQGLPTQRVDDH